MQTTGLAPDSIGGLYEGDALGPALRDARRRTLALYAHLDPSIDFPQIPIVNLPRWELPHIAWFQERWCLRLQPSGALGPSLLPDADALFDSSAVPHATRWSLPFPSATRTAEYMRETLEATLEALAAGRGERYYYELALLHEDMHGEALLMTLQTLALPAPPFPAIEPHAYDVRPAHDVRFEGGEFLLGARRAAPGFVFDNEKWAHPVRVAPFAMADRPVSQGEFLAFVADGGYRRPEWWTKEGWQWRERDGREAPKHWRRDGARWSQRRFDRWIALEAAAPMVHVSLHEAMAYCRWAGRRLPTEAEWEFAATNGGSDDRYPWGDEPPAQALGLDLRCIAAPGFAGDAQPSRSGLGQLIGGVWEWTSSAFEPYPEFRPDPYRDYSQPWFHSHYVLRGGSFATRSRLAHGRYRNFYLPERCDPFAGLRTCAVEAR